METLEATAVFLVICIPSLLFLLAWRKVSGSGRLPPGPVAFPIIGNTLQLNMKNLPKHVEEVRVFSWYQLWGFRWTLSRAWHKPSMVAIPCHSSQISDSFFPLNNQLWMLDVNCSG